MSDRIKELFDNAEIIEPQAPLPLRRDTAPPQPYPIKALGKVLAGAALGIMDKVQCPDAIAAQSVLAAAALASQAHANVVHPATKEQRPLSLFMITVAASGDRKSSADKPALDPVRQREAELHDKHKQDKQSYDDARALYDREREAALKMKGPREERKKALADLGPPPCPPLMPVLVVTEPTLEGLHKLMAAGEPSMGLFSDEGGGFIGGHAMTEDARLRTATGLSDLWDGKPVKRVRGGEGVMILHGRRLAAHLMAQPGIVEGLLADPLFIQQGLTSRLLVAAPASIAGTRMQRQPKLTTEPALKKYREKMLGLLRHPQPRAGPSDATLLPRSIHLTEPAVEKWKAFADECERELATGGRLEPIKAFGNKLPEHALRIAAVLKLFDDAKAAEISVDTLGQAVILARYYAEEALRLFEQA
ncbi:MAG TPA: YfjI family protein, partial [Novosphingobium sp.]|nr:YfjI family protein [Novosphingobium sp.]